MIRILLWTVALGFLVEEMPRALRRRRARAERLRLERERHGARLALAINLHWREFGCTRPMTDDEVDAAMLKVEMLYRDDRESHGLPRRGMLA